MRNLRIVDIGTECPICGFVTTSGNKMCEGCGYEHGGNTGDLNYPVYDGPYGNYISRGPNGNFYFGSARNDMSIDDYESEIEEG